MEAHRPPAPQLASLDFLVGRLQGEGWLGNPDYRYTKQVSGSWVADGHHLLLEMTADYPMRDGQCDRHTLVMIVSAGSEEGSLVSHAYTDGGGVIEYHPRATAEGLEFEDSPPHGSQGQRARKILRATSFGYEEILEVERGEDGFSPYARIELRRVEE